MSEPDTELELAATNDLVAELMRRFDDVIFFGQKRRPGGEDFVCQRISGDGVACAGLAAIATELSIKKHHRDSHLVDGDESTPSELGNDDDSS